jgi:glycerate kinase
VTETLIERISALRVLLAPDKFKGSMRASQVCAALAEGIRECAPATEIISIPMADGGDGTVDAAVASGFEAVAITVSGPTGEPVVSAYARRGDDAVVELAGTCGLGLLPGGHPDPMGASSAGLGQALAAALDAGCRHIVLGIGGSASTDGGAGLLVALGARLLTANGSAITLNGAGLAEVAELDLTGLHSALRQTEIVVACDVDNPLLGEAGAAAVYGPQKGASAAQVDLLDLALSRWADLVERRTGEDHRHDQGAGAAGGVGFAAIAVLGATLVPGAELILDLVGFPAALDGADLVVTGEGSLDEQTLHGKAPAGVAAAARSAAVTTVAVAGRVALTPERLITAGIAQAYSLAELEPDVERSMTCARSLLAVTGRKLALDWIVGR